MKCGCLADIQNSHNGGERKWGSANKRGGTSPCSRSRSVRHSAITRRNASRSIVWYDLLWTREFIWVEKRRNSTIDQKFNGKLCTSLCTRIVIIFQQQLGFYIRSKGSVKIFRQIWSINRSTRSAKHVCEKTNADKLWKARLGKTVVQHTQKTRWTRKVQRKALLIGHSFSQIF